MNILITGGTGFVGRALIQKLIEQGEQVTILSRTPQNFTACFPKTIRFLTALSPTDTFDAVINLAGEPIFNRAWTEKQKNILFRSRINLTNQLVEKINLTKQTGVLISASATGIYGDYGNAPITEQSPVRQHFVAKLCREWEQAALRAKTRVCVMRIGMVLDKSGGALNKMLPIYQRGLGGRLGAGTQYWSWIALKDMVNGILFLLDNSNAQGIFNFSAPTPVTNQEFNRQLGRALHKPSCLHVPASLLKFILGERASILLDSQKVYPIALLKHGFIFQFSVLENYLQKDLIG